MSAPYRSTAALATAMNLEPPRTPRVFVHERQIEVAATVLTDSREPLVITGRAGSGTSTVAIEAARRAAKAHGRVVTYVDLSFLDDTADIIRRILISSAAPSHLLVEGSVESQLRGLSAHLRNGHLLVLDNASGAEYLSETVEQLGVPCVVATRGFSGSLAARQKAIVLKNLNTSEAVGLAPRLQKIRYLTQFDVSTPLLVRMIAHLSDKHLDRLLTLGVERSGRSSATIAQILLLLSSTERSLIRAITHLPWRSISPSDAFVLAAGSATAARAALRQLASLGMLVGEGRAGGYRVQHSVGQMMRNEIFDSPDPHSVAREAFEVARQHQRAGGGADFDLRGLSFADDSTVWLTSRQLDSVAWVEREWTALHQALREAGPETTPDYESVVTSLRRTLNLLERRSDVRWIDEVLYRSFRLEGRTLEEREALDSLASSLIQDGRPEEAMPVLRQMLRLSREMEGRPFLGHDLVRLAELHGKLGQPAASVPLLEEAVGIFRQSQLAGDEARALLVLGNVYDSQQKWDDAEMTYRRAADLLRDADTPWRVSALLRLGSAHERHGRIEEAAGTYAAAAGLANSERPDLLVASLESLGRLAMRVGDWETAQSDFSRALTVASESALFEDVVQILLSLAELHERNGEGEAASRALRSALRTSRSSKLTQWEPLVLERLGALQASQGEWELGVSSLRDAAELWRQAGRKLDEARTLVRLGELAMERGQPAQAVVFLADARGILQLFASSGRGQVSYLLALAHARTGANAQTLHYLEEAASLGRLESDGDLEMGALRALMNLYASDGATETLQAASDRLRVLETNALK